MITTVKPAALGRECSAHNCFIEFIYNRLPLPPIAKIE